MKLPHLFLFTPLALSLALPQSHFAVAQNPQEWTSLQQTFARPNFPGQYQKYGHRVTLSHGQFIAKVTRDFSAQEQVTSLLTIHLAEIDTAKMAIQRGAEDCQPRLWYLFIPVKNPTHAPARVRATPQTDRGHLIVKDEVRIYPGRREEDTWILTRMYLNFDNKAAAAQAILDITAACNK